ncbi:hypothetical protein F3Y22_tig00116997pilonHSYRG00953 [Hibiscus syriacus]|uniref:Granulins domain-containing protein n=1 Tax=Hibiscus syriacus TaxID=106335 RepID=A0A6A2WMA9_HIBSY|nr:hypothetical protein F3Y22_tig00116997pilonHSYRG00953 [Hibiscus syriacus]
MVKNSEGEMILASAEQMESLYKLQETVFLNPILNYVLRKGRPRRTFLAPCGMRDMFSRWIGREIVLRVLIDSYKDVPTNDENTLKKTLVYQPVSVAIEAGGRLYQDGKKPAQYSKRQVSVIIITAVPTAVLAAVPLSTMATAFLVGCCPLEAATCCDDHYSCCPRNYPSKGNPMAVKALRRTAATPLWEHGNGGKKNSA